MPPVASSSLGSLFKTSSGGTPLKARQEYYVGGEVPWLLSGEVAQGEIWAATNFITQAGLQNSSAKIFPKDTVLVAMYGATAGEVGILRFEAATNQAVCGIFPNDQFLPEYLYYVLLSKKDELVGKAAGNAQPNISQGKIRDTPVPLTDKAEQSRIVAILDEAFEGIATARTNTEKNVQNARELFRTRLRSIFGSVNGRPLADGWHETQIKELGIVQSGAGFPMAVQGLIEGGIPFYKVSDMNIPGNEREMIYENNSITEATRRTLGASLFPSGSVIFPKIGGAIATNKKRIVTQDCCVDNNVMGVVPKVERVDPEFLYYFFLGHDLREFANEAHLPSIRKTVVEEWKLSVPHRLDEQRRIVSELESLEEQVQSLERIYAAKLDALDELKKSLLHQAFNDLL